MVLMKRQLWRFVEANGEPRQAVPWLKQEDADQEGALGGVTFVGTGLGKKSWGGWGRGSSSSPSSPLDPTMKWSRHMFNVCFDCFTETMFNAILSLPLIVRGPIGFGRKAEEQAGAW